MHGPGLHSNSVILYLRLFTSFSAILLTRLNKNYIWWLDCVQPIFLQKSGIKADNPGIFAQVPICCRMSLSDLIELLFGHSSMCVINKHFDKIDYEQHRKRVTPAFTTWSMRSQRLAWLDFVRFYHYSGFENGSIYSFILSQYFLSGTSALDRLPVIGSKSFLEQWPLYCNFHMGNFEWNQLESISAILSQ